MSISQTTELLIVFNNKTCEIIINHADYWTDRHHPLSINQYSMSPHHNSLTEGSLSLELIAA